MASKQYTEYRRFVGEMQGMLDTASAEKRELTGEEARRFDRISEAVNRLSRVLQGEADLREFGDPGGEVETEFRKLISGEVRSIEVTDNSRERRDRVNEVYVKVTAKIPAAH